MTSEPAVEAIRTRIGEAGLMVPPDIVQSCAAYLDLLSAWNRRINLTALPLSPAPPHAVDRLIVEPLLAARFLPETAVWADLGSGGGSPAIPLKLARPRSTLTMVESRERKGAFLREAVRVLELAQTSVLTLRMEESGLRQLDAVSIRAVRVDSETRRLVSEMLRAGGTVLAFGSTTASWPGFEIVDEVPGPSGSDRLIVAKPA